LREVPEIKRVDLAETILLLLSSGWGDPASFPWYEKPEPIALQRAVTVLTDLGALDGRGALTTLGRRMAVFPAHPRYARMLMAAHDLDCVRRSGRTESSLWSPTPPRDCTRTRHKSHTSYASTNPPPALTPLKSN